VLQRRLVKWGVQGILKHLAKLLAGIHGKITWPAFDAADKMGNPIVWTQFAGLLLFLLRECADGVAYHLRFGLTPLSR
jgi:hypothetical protein